MRPWSSLLYTKRAWECGFCLSSSQSLSVEKDSSGEGRGDQRMLRERKAENETVTAVGVELANNHLITSAPAAQSTGLRPAEIRPLHPLTQTKTGHL